MHTMNCTRRGFLKTAGLALACLRTAALPTLARDSQRRPNVLLITADDMNWDSPACFGGGTPDITPNIDRLASRGMRFMHAHVTIAVCQPCRSVLMTGRYPHRNGAEGFEPIDLDVPTLQEHLQKGGYLNGILGKVGHLAPPAKYPWDMAHDMGQLGMGRDPDIYYEFASQFLSRAANEDKPFFLMANSHDPHRPFHGSQQEQNKWKKQRDQIPAPSRVYEPDEIDVPGFLPDIPDVRKEIAEYCCSVKRCDDTVGAVLRALDESGLADNTLVMFLSDHGMALPFAKTNCYLHSTRTPWIAAWPDRIKPGAVDDKHFISTIDYMPTILDAAGLPGPGGMDGFSFLPVLLGKSQEGRDTVFTQFHQTSGRNRYPMRCVQDRRFGYIFNTWADGKRVFRNESQSGRTFKAMQAAARKDDQIAERVKLFQYRVVEEFYDFKNDPDALHNLVDDPQYAGPLNHMRSLLEQYMKQTGDVALKAFRNRNSPEALTKFTAEQQARAKPPRKKNVRKNRTRRQ